MASNKELYTILGVDETASDAAIKSAYERLVADNPEGTPMHSRIVEAYTILSDIDSRAEYDIKGKVYRNGKRRHRSGPTNRIEKVRYTLNTLFLAGAAITTVLFILQWSGSISTTPFYVACGISMLIKVAEYILRLVP